MATEGGRAQPPLTQVFFDEPYRFDFFQAVRLLERIYTERQPVGRDGGDPAREVVRFRTRPSLAFPPSQLYSMARNGAEDDKGGPPEMTIAFMGLTGPTGVLPLHYTELLAERARYKDRTLWEFLDLFNHRMVSLFYRAWEKHRFPVAYERGELDRFTEYLFDIIGMGTRGLRRERLSMPDEGLLLYGGLIVQQPHSASAVQAILGDYFGVTAQVEQFTGQWLILDEEDLSRLGTANNQLGVNTIAGSRVWDTQSKFRIKFGPLDYREFNNFLPVGSAFKPVAGLARFLVGAEFDFDVQLILKAEQVPGCMIGTNAPSPAMLGWTTWLKTQPFAENDSQVILSINN